MTSMTPGPPAGLAFPFLRQRAPGEAAGVRRDRDPRALLLGDGTARYLSDVLDTMGEHVDALKFAGGALDSEPPLGDLDHRGDVGRRGRFCPDR